jgi:hypothetical protein
MAVEAAGRRDTVESREQANTARKVASDAERAAKHAAAELEASKPIEEL